MDHLDSLDIRFVEIEDPVDRGGGGEVVAGMIGLVHGDGPGTPFGLVYSGGRNGPPERAIARGMATAKGLVHRLSCRHAASVVPIADIVDSIVAHVRADIASDPEDTVFGWAWDEDEDEDLSGKIEATLRPALVRVDPFRVTRDFCRALQVDGDIRLFRLLEPACERVLAEAAKEECIVAALATDCERFTGLSRAFARSAETWRQAVEAQSAPAP